MIRRHKNPFDWSLRGWTVFCIAVDSTNSTNDQPLSKCKQEEQELAISTSADPYLCLSTENTGNYLTPGSGLLLALSSLGNHCSSVAHEGERSGVQTCFNLTQHSVEFSFVYLCCAECTKECYLDRADEAFPVVAQPWHLAMNPPPDSVTDQLPLEAVDAEVVPRTSEFSD
ncbi:hypothetical protein T10_5593 [Trichinella papuae]|uniref:Uncharacterized protein n=1 Tax=Trichinella papuae TaxID=268474 RepID=A0A0V1M4N4_9BILA|nr:hypothetical protein T10_5593 [Trichinella papuae]